MKQHIQRLENHNVIVIGAGPAGLLAAGRAAELGAEVLILEKMNAPGKKLLITGKGRCNLANSAPVSEFITRVYPNGKFLKNSFSQYYSKDILALLESYGVDITLERGGRYFPTSQKSADILNAFLKWTEELGVKIECGARVQKLLIQNGKITGVKSKEKEYFAKNVIVATGGKSYSGTGSTGDGYDLARQAGHNIEKPIPALVPVETKGNISQKLQGLHLKNVKAVVWVDNKKAGEAFGEMLFTHFGLSGPIILTLSRIMVKALQSKQKVEVTIDLKPALDEQKLDKRLQRDLNEHGKKQLVNIFRGWLPASMIPVFIEELKLDGTKACNQVSGKERKQIRHLMKNLRLEVSHNRSFKEAIITAGGILTSEIRPRTMESKIIKGLYFAGEVIDLDAETGGYNLQIAYSTGWVAGNAAASADISEV